MRSVVASPITVEGRIWGAIAVLSPRLEPLPESTEARLADFTELVATALANAESRAELAASEARARKLAEEQAALRRVATLVATGATEAELLAGVAQEVRRVLGVPMVTIDRYEGDASSTVVASLDDPGFPVGSRWPLDGPSLGATVLETGRPARIDDYDGLRSSSAAAARTFTVTSTVGAPIVVDGTVWGVICIGTTDAEPLPPDTEDRLVAFTELVATAVSNATMHAEVAASRARVIAAGDETRRRIERDLHDGAQQQLVTLALALRSAQGRVPAGLDDLRTEVGRFADRLTSVIEELREMSRGIHPAILTEGGLSPAVEALALRSPVPVKLNVRSEHRFPDGIEVAAYYVVSEALTNAAKHAEASRVQIDLHVEGETLCLSVVDDGVGGADPSGGSGLIGLKDRVEALGGTIDVASPPGRGTRLDVEFPLVGDSSVASDSKPLSRV
jgi:signal transduction histidine kinase